MIIDRNKWYTLWDLIHGRWYLDRSYSGAYFLPGSYGHQYLTSPLHKVLPQGMNPNQ